MAVVIDTTVLIDLERRKDSSHIHLETRLGEPVALASITVSEVLVGAFRAANQAQREARERYVLDVIDSYTVLPFTLEAARVHARLGASMARIGQRIGAHDLIIAATTIFHGFSVLTHNLRDFQRVPDLTVKAIDW